MIFFKSELLPLIVDRLCFTRIKLHIYPDIWEILCWRTLFKNFFLSRKRLYRMYIYVYMMHQCICMLYIPMSSPRRCTSPWFQIEPSLSQAWNAFIRIREGAFSHANLATWLLAITLTRFEPNSILIEVSRIQTGKISFRVCSIYIALLQFVGLFILHMKALYIRKKFF